MFDQSGENTRVVFVKTYFMSLKDNECVLHLRLIKYELVLYVHIAKSLLIVSFGLINYPYTKTTYMFFPDWSKTHLFLY